MNTSGSSTPRRSSTELVPSLQNAAFALISSKRAREAFNIALEPDKVRDSYGRTGMGQGCLLARRLVESGVRFVSVRSGNWDHHQQVFNNLSKENLPEFDKAFAGSGRLGAAWIAGHHSCNRCDRIRKDARDQRQCGKRSLAECLFDCRGRWRDRGRPRDRKNR